MMNEINPNKLVVRKNHCSSLPTYDQAIEYDPLPTYEDILRRNTSELRKDYEFFYKLIDGFRIGAMVFLTYGVSILNLLLVICKLALRNHHDKFQIKDALLLIVLILLLSIDCIMSFLIFPKAVKNVPNGNNIFSFIVLVLYRCLCVFIGVFYSVKYTGDLTVYLRN
ncbi:hypothetical protein EDEG_02903 [Edhazardia aedis USNM 41457]|uniref:Uncharacterized protein n=1 Tax=Edhazardia aedis (strain USNM 41457) TaxID=1003232 RepID=J9D5B0_EDHAE|nr:hypothetical protein EDEG_02903 [Edhazardia aedis USNM 41457]|eukprot:EJW02719.1 hypothetical protein EDEG_02903 [Edhazardia aedis USNM 41457]